MVDSASICILIVVIIGPCRQRTDSIFGIVCIFHDKDALSLSYFHSSARSLAYSFFLSFFPIRVAF